MGTYFFLIHFGVKKDVPIMLKVENEFGPSLGPTVIFHIYALLSRGDKSNTEVPNITSYYPC